MNPSLWILLQLLLLACASGASLTTSKCYTERGTKSVKNVVTISLTRTISYPAKITITVTPTKTVTPKPASTTVITETSITTITSTAPQQTNTITETEIQTIETTILGEPSVVTSTATSTTTTSIVAPGFTPVQSTLPGATYISSLSKRTEDVEFENDFSPNHGTLFARQARRICIPKSTDKTKYYPQKVTCYKFIVAGSGAKTTVTARTTRTVTAARPTSTSKTTTIQTVTSTFVPDDASTTIITTSVITNTAVETPVSTTTTSTIVTETVLLPAATCGPANFANAVNGVGIATVGQTSDGAFTPLITADTTATACCNSCAVNPNCGFFAFLPAYSQCYVVTSEGGVCSQGRESYNALTAASGYRYYTVGNGNCGFIESSSPV